MLYDSVCSPCSVCCSDSYLCPLDSTVASDHVSRFTRTGKDYDFNEEGQGQKHQGRAEVHNFNAAVSPTQQVGGLHVAMHYVVVMQVAQPLHRGKCTFPHGCMEGRSPGE